MDSFLPTACTLRHPLAYSYTKMKKFTHVSFYKFADVQDPGALKKHLQDLAQSFELKGTILIAEEGLNAMLAGRPEKLRGFISEFQKDQRFQNILFKFNEAETEPFKKLLIKIKKEILTFKEPSVKPHLKTGKYIKPLELKERLEKGEDIVLLDTRNDFEVQTGTFKNAVNPKISHFSQFKKALESLNHLKDKKIVTFCTGGIRCEKATSYMLDQGFKDVYQIEGGILQYLQDTGGDFWEGNCFVFDNRIAVDKDLHEVPSKN